MTIYIVIIPLEGDGRDFDMELLSDAPQWDRHPGERRFIANVNGGDSLEYHDDENPPR